MSDGIPSSLIGNDLRRIADALEALVYLKQKEADFEEKDFHGERKDPRIWITCRAELTRLLEEHPFIDWETAKGNDVFRDPKVGNMYRLHQWQRFLDHHAIPNKPDDGTKVAIVAWGKADKSGPVGCTRKDSEHCAQRASDWSQSKAWEWDRYGSKDDCHFCQEHRKKEDSRYKDILRKSKLLRDPDDENRKLEKLGLGVN